MPFNMFSDCFCLFNLFVFDRVIRIAIIGSYMVEICPTPYSAAMGPRASRVRPPRDCAPGRAPVLKCVWMKLHRHSFCAIFEIDFSCVYSLRG